MWGHGISGVSLLNVNSRAALPSMFGGTIATAFAMQALVGHDTFALVR